MTNKNRVNEIDLLRFIAAMLVISFHYMFRGYAADDLSIMPYSYLSPFPKYGYLGVELFFLISGFVILMTASSGSLREFFISRVVRLYPAFWASCTLTFIVILAIGGTHFTATLSNYLLNMTMMSEFLGIKDMDGAYWSLFVEMHFYLLVAFILFLKRIHQAQSFLIAWLVVSVLFEVFSIQKLRALLIIDYSAFFIAGATFYLIWDKGLNLTRGSIIFASLGLAIYKSTYGLSGFERHFHTQLDPYIVAAIVITFFLMLSLVALRKTGYFGRTRWMLVGALTYPVYLLHQNIGYMIFNAAFPKNNPHLILIGTITSMLVLAYLVHTQIEKKIAPIMKRAINSLFDYIQSHIKRSAINVKTLD
jgi:peptidoglycan/LPS O-acetylase OafA/YrhL